MNRITLINNSGKDLSIKTATMTELGDFRQSESVPKAFKLGNGLVHDFLAESGTKIEAFTNDFHEYGPGDSYGKFTIGSNSAIITIIPETAKIPEKKRYANMFIKPWETRARQGFATKSDNMHYMPMIGFKEVQTFAQPKTLEQKSLNYTSSFVMLAILFVIFVAILALLLWRKKNIKGGETDDFEEYRNPPNDETTEDEPEPIIV